MSRRSRNIQDRRGMPVGVAGGGGMLVLALVVFLMGGDPSVLLTGGPQAGYEQDVSSPQAQEQRDFVAAVLGNTEDVWTDLFAAGGRTYEPPVLVLFSGAVNSACGFAQAAVGPFYCPLDRQIYLDTAFFHDLDAELGAPGDFARAYVIAHEVGHHVQTILGISDDVAARQRRLGGRADANELSVRQELQADCFAGLWANYAGAQYNLIEEGDVEEALNAASQIGDDRLQKRSQGYVVPDSFTHGSAVQRHGWFRRGFESGNLAECDTFAVRKP